MERAFQDLETTYDSFLPGDKREYNKKMEQSRKDYNEARRVFLSHEEAVNVQKNKEALAYKTGGGADF